jgi:hypothetical protein
MEKKAFQGGTGAEAQLGTVFRPRDLAFLPGTVRSEKIRDAAEYGGLRVRLEVRLDRHASMFSGYRLW